jgi:phospholipase C
MYSLTGDVQHDRLGVPILDNNHGDNFLLSRELTIYDLLTKRGLRWRVYESDPSITMLRMFARYATNNTDIVSISRLEADIANGDLPQFTAIEPAMHHHPQNDDHPDADMYRGQIFLKRVYDALRSNSAVWRETLLIITYDEHGGLYDHVVPPVADLLGWSRRPPVAPPIIEGEGGEGGRGGIRSGGRLGDVLGEEPTRRPHIEDIVRAAQIPPLKIAYGVRVPSFVVSPWAMPGKGESVTLDHCSILKTVLATFAGNDKPFFSDRVNASYSFNGYLTAEQPRMDVPASPALGQLPIDVRRPASGASAIVTPTLSRKEMRTGPIDYHVLSGRLARMLGR